MFGEAFVQRPWKIATSIRMTVQTKMSLGAEMPRT
jgi:hypothetical protein